MDRSIRRLVFCLTGLATAALATPAAVETLQTFRGARKDWTAVVPTISAANVVEMIRDGKKVVFVDVRESAEFDEFHIPGAVHSPVRDIDGLDLDDLKGADVVVPYCLKDFRGCEGAKTLQARGLDNVALIQGFGIKTWKKAHLPVAGSFSGLTDERAMDELLAKAEGASR